MVSKLLNQHSEDQVFPEQVELINKKKCSDKNSKTQINGRNKRYSRISVGFYITTEKGIYSYKLTDRLATVVDAGYVKSIKEGVFKNKVRI